MWFAISCDCARLHVRGPPLTGAAVAGLARRPPANKEAGAVGDWVTETLAVEANSFSKPLTVAAGWFGFKEAEQLDSLYPRGRHAACGVPIAADSGGTVGGRCPSECPLYQEDQQGGDARGFCVFQCVDSSAQACAAANPEATVADPGWGICRSCWVEGCQRCAGDGTDRCAECAITFRLVDGKCIDRYSELWMAAAVVCVCLLLVVVAWVVSLKSRPVTNPYAVDKGLELRSRAKLRVPVNLEPPQASISAASQHQPSSPGPAAPPESSQAVAETRAGAEVGAEDEQGSSASSSGRRWAQREGRWAPVEVSAGVDGRDGTPAERVQRSATGDSYGFAADSVYLPGDSYRLSDDGDSHGSPRRAPTGSDSSGSEDPGEEFARAVDCKDEFASTRHMWPLSTNLCKQDVAGPGVILSFNFQAAVIVWGLTVAMLWVAMALLIDTDLLRMGTRSASTPRDQCIVVAWGFETQRRLMWAKVLFLASVYALSFVGSLVHSVRQLRAFQRYDEVETTHRDYAVKLSGIPAMDPSRLVEEELKDLLESATGRPAVGVSVCWTIKSHKQSDLLHGVIALDLQEREEAMAGIKSDEGGDSSAAREAETKGRTLVERLFTRIEKIFVHERVQRIMRKGKSRQKGLQKQRHRRRRLSEVADASDIADTRSLPDGDSPVRPVREESAPDLDATVVNELLAMSHSGEAWAVFNSEADRDAAVEAISGAGGIEFEGCRITLEKAALDPDSINWGNSGSLNSTSDLVMKLAVGGGVVMLSLAVWVVAFFGPYAYFVTNATYTYGEEPSAMEVLAFSVVVIAGNALMYLVCSEVSDWVGFHTTDAREVCYMLLYNLACVVQVILDLAITYNISYMRLVGKEIRTYDGTPVSELPTFVERIESYPMQQELGREVYMFAWPATFLIPFLIEPLVTVYAPFKLMEYIVRSHREISHATAEAYLSAVPFDLSRYADINLNIMLAVLIFFFPGGYTLPLFAGLVFSHMFIYCYDQWRILRSSPSCYFSTMQVDWWVQWILSIPCGLILSALVFKARSGPADWLPALQEDGLQWGLHGFQRRIDGHLESSADAELLSEAAAAFLLHVIVHTLLLLYVVPLFGRPDKEPSTQAYETCSRRLASSFFSTNPVHCLRSSYVYGHSPPCDFRVRGKEHLLRPNPKIGCYFQDTWAHGEHYTLDGTMAEGVQSARDALESTKARWAARRSKGVQSAKDVLASTKARLAARGLGRNTI